MKTERTAAIVIATITAFACASSESVPGGGVTDGGSSSDGGAIDPSQPYSLIGDLAPGSRLSRVLDLLPSGNDMHALVLSCSGGFDGKTEVVTLDAGGKVKGRFTVASKPSCSVDDKGSYGDFGPMRGIVLPSGDIALAGTNFEGDGPQLVQRYSATGQLKWSVELPVLDSYAYVYALSAVGDEVWVAGSLLSKNTSVLGLNIPYADIDAGSLFAFGIDASGKLAHHVHVTQKPLIHLGAQGAVALRQDGAGGLWLLADRPESSPSAGLFHIKGDGTVDLSAGTGVDTYVPNDAPADVLPAPGDPKVFMYLGSASPPSLAMMTVGASGPKDSLPIPGIKLHARHTPTVMANGVPVFVGFSPSPTSGNDREISYQSAAIGYVSSGAPTVSSFAASHGSTFYSVALDSKNRIWAGGAAGGRFRVGERTSTIAQAASGDAFILVFDDLAAIGRAAKDNEKHPLPTCKVTSEACASCMKTAACLTSCDRDGTCGPVFSSARSCICDAQIDHPQEIETRAESCLEPVKQVGPNGNTAANCLAVTCADACK